VDWDPMTLCDPLAYLLVRGTPSFIFYLSQLVYFLTNL
jgi:hypothetical protein